MTALDRPDTCGLLRKWEPEPKQEAEDVVVVVAFEQGIPFDVLTYNGRSFTHYDFVYSKGEQCLFYHMTGCGPGMLEYSTGPEVTYWVRPGFDVPSLPESERSAWPLDYAPEQIFEANVEGDTVYCGICRDYWSAESRWACPHLYWDDEFSEWVGSGSCEAEPHRHKSGFFYLLDRTGIAVALREALLRQNYRITLSTSLEFRLGRECRWFYEDELSEDNQERYNRIENAIFWLLSLEAGVTTEAEALTIGWISEYLSLTREAWCYYRLPLEQEPYEFYQRDLRRLLEQGHSLAEIDGFCRRKQSTPWKRYLVLNALHYLTWQKGAGA